MRFRTLLSVLALLVLAAPSAAVVKVYDATPPHGTPGDAFTFDNGLCPPVQPRLGIIWGGFRIDDPGGGTVTVVEHSQEPTTINQFDIVTLFGPGAFVFINASSTVTPGVPYSGTGSTAPGGSVVWGVVGGWTQTGFVFCAASPTTICSNSSASPHGTTSNLGPMPSPTYDLGTWSFDAEGDMLAASTYISRTNSGGTSNQQTQLRGAFVGGGIPALPVIGVGALAVALLVAGARTALRQR